MAPDSCNFLTPPETFCKTDPHHKASGWICPGNLCRSLRPRLQVLRAIERGKFRVWLDTIVRVAAALDVTTAGLLSRAKLRTSLEGEQTIRTQGAYPISLPKLFVR